MGELQEPVHRDDHVLLRRAVVEHVRSVSTTRRFPPVLHVGTPGAAVRRFTVLDHEPTDHALRVDVVAAMRGRRVDGGSPWVWLTRAGQLEPSRLDAAWLRAASTAYAEAGVADLTMVVVTRRGWRDPRSGVSRTWVRLRTGPAPGGA